MTEPFSAFEVTEAMRNLDASKGSGPDGIPPGFYKNLADTLACPLAGISNNSLDTGTFPTLWKEAHVVPIHKSSFC